MVLNGDSELASILTLSRPDDQRKVSARIVMTGNYPDSDFKKAGWHPNRELDPDTLVDIDADLRGDLLYIEGFYSKASDPVAYPALSRNDVQRVRGIARHLMCIVLRALPSVSKVEWHPAVRPGTRPSYNSKPTTCSAPKFYRVSTN